MQASRTSLRQDAFTLIELLVLIVIIVLVVAMLLPHLSGSGKAKVPQCLNNLKQIDVGFVLFSVDNHGEFPMQIPVANGGTMEFLYSGHTFPHFEKLKNYGPGPALFLCPFETNRQVAVSYEALNDLALSYFVNGAASSNDALHSIMAGDRVLQVDRQSVKPGLLTVTTSLNLSWAPLHAKGGCIAFADGHAEFTRGNRLSSALKEQPSATNYFSIP